MKPLFSHDGSTLQHIFSNFGIGAQPAKTADIAALVRGDGA